MGKEIEARGNLCEGINAIQNGKLCKLSLEKKALKICVAAGGLIRQKWGETYTIPIERIVDIDIVSEKNIKEKNKSVLGRGIAGAIVFGSVGAILGGLSGAGTKKETKETEFLNIAYEKDDEIKTIIFKLDELAISHYREWEFVKYYKDTFVKPNMMKNESGEILL